MALDLFQKGGLLIWPILFCSIAGTTIYFERLALYRRVLKNYQHNDAVYRMILNHDTAAARDWLNRHLNPYAADKRILFEALAADKPDRETLEMILMHGVEREMAGFSKKLGSLAVLGGICPLLGLLGTVIGMIKAFMVVESMGGSVNAAVLAGGIWEAMITTAFGLLAAIPLLFFHNHLTGKYQAIQQNLEEVAITFMKVWARSRNSSA